MRTPFQELIEKTEKTIEQSPPHSDFNIGYVSALEEIISVVEEYYLEREKEVILKSFVAGDERGTKEIPFNAEQYYSQNFNDEK